MGFMLSVFLCVFGLIIYVQAANAASSDHNPAFYKGDHDAGYAEVRKGAFLFWWLYYAGGDKNTALEKPLIIWIQGSPGSSASAITNFQEIGPQDIYSGNRNLSWVHKRNVLFVDSPVGSGFSYYIDPSLLVKTEKQLVKDLVELMKHFLRKLPEFEAVPAHIFSQSYGGKIVPRFVYNLHKEKAVGKIKMNIKSVGLGSAFVSPKDFTLAYPKCLLNMGLIDIINYDKINKYSLDAAKACNNGFYNKAHKLRKEMFIYTPNGYEINMFNMIKPHGIGEDIELSNFMNTAVKDALRNVIPDNIGYKYLDVDVFRALNDEMMIPSIDFVEMLLNKTDIAIAVYGGNLNVVLPITGALKWVNNLNWKGTKEFKKANRHQMPGHRNGQYKSFGKLSFWWIYNAGQSVADNLEAMEHILRSVVDHDPKSGGQDTRDPDESLLT